MRRLCTLLSLLVLGAVVSGSAFAADQKGEVNTGTITGMIEAEGKGPLAGGVVVFFSEQAGPPPSATKYWRVPTDAFKVDGQGRFNAILREGNYYMGAIRRHAEEPLGPPRDGDYFFVYEDEQGEPKLHSVSKGGVIDMGTITAKPFSRAELVTEGVTSVEGTIRNEKGDPVEGVSVFAFATPSMVDRPVFASDKSDRDGRYLLRLSGGGTYYLRARVSYGGGPPAADQLMGVYNDGKPFMVGTGEKKQGADIKVTRILRRLEIR